VANSAFPPYIDRAGGGAHNGRSMASEISRSNRSGSLKDNYRLANCALADTVSQHRRIGQVDLRSEQVGEAVFQMGPTQHGKFLRGVEFGHQIHVGLRSGIPARDRTEQGQSVSQDQVSTPALFSSASCSRSVAMTCSRSIPASCHIEARGTTVQGFRKRCGQPALRRASSTASGCRAITASSTRAGPSGRVRPCSQFFSVAG